MKSNRKKTAVDGRRFFFNNLMTMIMEAKTKILELKQAWKEAGETERQQIEKETDFFLDSLTEEQKKEVIEAVDEDFRAIHTEIADIKHTINIRNALAPILPVISVSHLAKNYFHKTPQWFYQRMNGNKVNGKPVTFSDTELKTLHFAIQDISRQLSTVQL